MLCIQHLKKSGKLLHPAITGDLVGYFSYDYIHYAEPTLDFSKLKNDDFCDVGLMLFDRVIVFDHYRQKLILVTGVRSEITTDIGAMVNLVKEESDIPCAVGFGISTPEQAARMAEKCDGVIVGSAIVKLCGQYGKDCVPYVAEYVKSMKDAIRA